MAATAKLENAIASIGKHLADSLTGTTLEFPGVDLDTKGNASWVRVDYLDVKRTYIRNVSATERGYISYLPVSFNCFTKQTSNTYIPLELRDLVFDAMKPMTEITMKDYSGAGATIGTMLCWEVISDTPLPIVDGIRGHNITVLVRYEEQF